MGYFSVASFQKPEKIYLENSNLLYALAEQTPNTGTVREVFFYNQLKERHQIHQSDVGDFVIDRKFTFEVGGAKKSKNQLQGIADAWVVKDDIERPVGSSLPLWMFGFLY